jgi:hypothetical protein
LGKSSLDYANRRAKRKDIKQAIINEKWGDRWEKEEREDLRS